MRQPTGISSDESRMENENELGQLHDQFPKERRGPCNGGIILSQMDHCLALQGPSGRCNSELSSSHSARVLLTNKNANYKASTVQNV